MRLPPALQRLRVRFADREISALVIVLLILSCGWLFAWIADEVAEDEWKAVDTRILLSLREPQQPSDPLGPPWMEESWRDITALGSMPVLLLITALVVGYLFLERKRRTAVLVMISVGGGTLLAFGVKDLFRRPRPDLVEAGTRVMTSSFPSGHSMMSAVTLLSIAALLSSVQRRRRVKAYLFSAAVTLMVLVGISRVYLGVHWPSDVLAGWSLGAAWALLCVLVSRALPRGQDPLPPDAR